MIAARVAGVPRPRSFSASFSCLVVHELAGRLHRAEQGALGVGLRGRGLPLPDGRLVRAALAGAELGQLLLVVLPVVRPAGVQHRPARVEHPHAPAPGTAPRSTRPATVVTSFTQAG